MSSYLIDYISLWRTFFLEFYKNLNHILNITTHAIDLGLFVIMLWLFDEREKLMNYISIISGTRFHISILMLGKLRYDLSLNWISTLYYWLIEYGTKIKELHELLTINYLWKIRLFEIGIINKEFCLFYGISGIISRSSYIYCNLIYLCYEYYLFINYVYYYSIVGDSLDRYLLRLNEIIESCRILYIILHTIFNLYLFNYSLNSIIMELLISEFIFNLYFIILFFILINSIESSKGIYSLFTFIYLFLINIIANDFLIINVINLFCKYYLIGDLIAVIGSIDFVLGSVDL